ncbi:MAG: hypothetical protein ACSLEM_01950 [Candidatus Malihini olakiniferum]
MKSANTNLVGHEPTATRNFLFLLFWILR